MNTRIRRILEMVARVREFCKAHPSGDPAYSTVMTSFEEHISRAEAIAARQYQGHASAKASRSRRRALRRALQSQILNYLCAVVDIAAKEAPELADLIRLPDANLGYHEFVIAVSGILAVAQPRKAVLIKYGMSDSLLDDLERMTAELEAANDAARTGRRDHMAARIDFEIVVDELLKDVRGLAGIYRYRFGTDEELLAEWELVRRVPGMPRLKVESGAEVPAPQPEVEPEAEAKKDGTAAPSEGGSPRAA